MMPKAPDVHQGNAFYAGYMATLTTADALAELVAAPSREQWAMNETLAYIGIHHPALRERALEIGNRLQVLADYPTPPNCTSPFAPAWIAEMVRRQG